MREVILVLNAGSSSLKFALFELAAAGVAQQALLSGQLDGLGARAHFKCKGANGEIVAESEPALAADPARAHRGALAFLLDWLATHNENLHVCAAGHRIVHGGSRYSAPQRITPALAEELDGLVPLAPLHQPHNLAAVGALAALRPELPQIGCFDTAFHRSQPPLAQMFALPRALSEEGVRRYGFHGLSYEYIADVLPQHLGARADGRVIVLHLGNGASLCALRGRKSIASSMGFTALDGLMMGTRCGNLDPGVLLYLMQYRGLGVEGLSDLLYKRSGLAGVSGISQDMRTLEASAEPAAREAIELFCYRIVREIGSAAAALGGLDALVFTAGIGQNSARVRERVCTGSAWLGLAFDAEANTRHAACISTPDSAVTALVIPTDEEWMIARHTAKMLAQ
ncbi:MAG: acetate/propionate family kinase [Rhodocyclaceae bacterium]|nr:acetate/propionate family kinase [Rhodocyclaceae bacterium]MBX3667924.1 acetate/propionate family kinase [Rhodocyclaceae bacterium]